MIYIVTLVSLSDLSQTTSEQLYIYKMECYCYTLAIKVILVYCYFEMHVYLFMESILFEARVYKQCNK